MNASEYTVELYVKGRVRKHIDASPTSDTDVIAMIFISVADFEGKRAIVQTGARACRGGCLLAFRETTRPRSVVS